MEIEEAQQLPPAPERVVRAVRRDNGPQDRNEIQMSDGSVGDGQDGQGH
ncbi:hypothetical protein [Actinopolyspora halophila]|nr:hypothetical protein [Actinopolyspora halophila]